LPKAEAILQTQNRIASGWTIATFGPPPTVPSQYPVGTRSKLLDETK